MQTKPVIDMKRIRRIHGGFSFIPHRFLNEGFFRSLRSDELILYVFFVLAADRFGMSWYSDPSIMKHTKLNPDQLNTARAGLERKELIAVESPFIQVLELPDCSLDGPSDTPQHPASKILKSLRGDSE